MVGVKNLGVKKHNLPFTKIVDDIIEQKQDNFNDEYEYQIAFVVSCVYDRIENKWRDNFVVFRKIWS